MVKAACDDRPAGISTSASHSIIVQAIPERMILAE